MPNVWGSMAQYEAIHWPWPVALYLFLASISAGSIIVSLLVKWNRHERENSSIWDAMIRSGALVAPISIFLGLLILIVDLGKPLSFYWLFVRYNFSSVMTIGVVFLLIYTPIVVVFMCLVFERVIFKYRIWILEILIDWLKGFHSYAKVIEYFLFAAAVCVAVYTGFLLSSLYPIPLWNNAIIPILFLTSGISSGIAINILVGKIFFKSTINEESVKYLLVMDLRVILTEFPLIGMLFIGLMYEGGDSLVVAKEALSSGVWSVVFWCGVVGIGLFLPLLTVLNALKHHVYRVNYIITNSIVVLLGVMLLRAYIIYAGQIYTGY